MTNAANNIDVQLLIWVSVFDSLAFILKSGIAGSYGISVFSFLRNCQTFPQQLHHVTFPSETHKDSKFLYILANTFFFFLNYNHSSLKLSIQKIKIMASGPITSWQTDGEKVETVTDFIFLGSRITADGSCSHKIKRHLLLEEKLWQT